MKQSLSVKEKEIVQISFEDDMATQLEAMYELIGKKGLIISHTQGNISVTPIMVGHYRFRDGSKMDVIPDIGGNGLVASDNTLTEMMYDIFNIKGKSDNMNLFEFFVKVFLSEVRMLMRRGFRSAYSQVQENETVFRGKLLFADNIRENLIHKERVYVEYGLFTPDRPENRVIKGTLESLIDKSHDDRNLRDMKIMLMNMKGIPSSRNLAKDIEACRIDRNMTDYESPLMWCSVFLGTSRKAFAFLINPDNIFEAYVARCSSRNGRGSLSVKCSSNTICDKVSITVVTITWQYRTEDGAILHDAEYLYSNAPGYARIPTNLGCKIRAMAVEYVEKNRSAGSFFNQFECN